MSDIDKDIEIVKDLVLNYNGTWYSSIIFDADIIEKAIENVLKELKINKKAVDNLLIKNTELKQESDIWQKIAEKLAEELVLTVNINKVCGTLDVEKKRCAKENISCKQCALDWARKEVEKNDN